MRISSLLALSLFGNAICQRVWTEAEQEIFKLNQRVGDFYALLGVEATATEREITKAYRAKSKETHPDKNPEAKGEYQRLVRVYAILKDKDGRLSYDSFRRTGFPAWNGKIWHTKKYKPALWQVVILINLLASFGHYLIMVANWRTADKREKRMLAERKLLTYQIIAKEYASLGLEFSKQDYKNQLHLIPEDIPFPRLMDTFWLKKFKYFTEKKDKAE